MYSNFELKNQRTGASASLKAISGTLGPDVLDISHLTRELGVFTFDPGFMATASTESKITYIDGDAGILLYRGYPVEQLAERASFLEVAKLLIDGSIPTAVELRDFESSIARHAITNEQFMQVFRGFRPEAHPMAMVSAVVASMAAFYQDDADFSIARNREVFAHRILAKLPMIAAAAYRHSRGQDCVDPRPELGYCGNLLQMLFAMPGEDYAVDPVAASALELLFILHADHEQNASTSTVRLAGSTGTNPYAAIASGVAALWGPAHGGANEAVLDMLEGIGSTDHIDRFLARVKNKTGGVRLMGFGHRVYKHFDPRASIIRGTCHRVLEKLGSRDNPLFDLALKLEEIALSDDYFLSGKLYPNVDFYSGIIYRALGIPRSMFTVMFAVARAAGWVAHWQEMVSDPQMKIGRPRQLYTGSVRREYAVTATP